ncbi:uncharacterized protein LOC127251449 [Andrographis paniculata]|uniref:uncharacterized protein LOC127251449 n=1 Tax=Andrographis paniculata TaxID=175694 RepID=UPI0021E8D282|nr:uncharacterized protein LOC127251449 [Andrographis paniculata]
MAKMGTAALESPLEALALNYLTYGFLAVVNSVWAWIAVVTAAVSFWRIRALSSPPELRRDAVSTSSSAARPEEEQAAQLNPPRPPAAGGDREGSTKTKFIVHYKVEDFRQDDDGGETDEDAESPAAAELVGFCEDWERMLVVRMGDLGWYRWQDRAVVDGSVVRLWRRATAAGGGGRFL